MSATQAVVLVEGYTDRAFWHGALRAAGCADAPMRGEHGRKMYLDPWNAPVAQGEFAMHSRTGGFIRIQPVRGRDNIPRALRALARNKVKPLKRAVVNVDADETIAGRPTGPQLRQQSIDAVLREVDPDAGVEAGTTWLFGHTLPVHYVAWRSPAPEAPGIPQQQVLERLLCVAAANADMQRPELVQQWLDSLKSPELQAPQFAWSYLAGWYADCGSYEGFIKRLWNEPATAALLREQLEKTGAWGVVEALAE
jgi:hypothetical protein